MPGAGGGDDFGYDPDWDGDWDIDRSLLGDDDDYEDGAFSVRVRERVLVRVRVRVVGSFRVGCVFLPRRLVLMSREAVVVVCAESRLMFSHTKKSQLLYILRML